MDRIPSCNRISSNASHLVRQKALALKSLLQKCRQITTNQAFKSWVNAGFNEVLIKKSFKSLDEHLHKGKKKESSQSNIEEAVEGVSQSDSLASEFHNKNPELEKRMLLSLLNSIKDTDSPEEILRKVLDFYPDFMLADDALDFLIDASSGKLAMSMDIAKEILNSRHGREIKAGRNISDQIKIFFEQINKPPTTLRSMYNDITGNPRPADKLFAEFSSEYDYDKMKTLISFLLHSLGSDLKSKGPSISRAQLQVLIDKVKELQGILGVYNFFKGRMDLISNQFRINNLMLPGYLNFEGLAKQFMAILAERYITMDKVFQIARNLNLYEEIIAQIIIFTQLRDAVRNISPRLYKSKRQKKDLLEAILEVLEELEDELEDEEDEDK